MMEICIGLCFPNVMIEIYMVYHKLAGRYQLKGMIEY